MYKLISASIVALVVLLGPSSPMQAAADHDDNEPICFSETGFCLREQFKAYWQQNGGLAVFGYPLTEARAERNKDTGKDYQTQWFERARIESHPENAAPYTMLLGRLGAAQLHRAQPTPDPREAGPRAGCLWFAQTGHNVCDQAQGRGFKTYWQTHGLQQPGQSTFQRSLALWGLPLTAPRLETNASGDRVLTQWFERARFEWHPTNPVQYAVLTGLVGTESWGPCGPPDSSLANTGYDTVYQATGRQLYCIGWRDDFDDERGFRIEVGSPTKPDMYHAPANTTYVIIPDNETPPQPTDPCVPRTYKVTVYALRPKGETVVGGFAIEGECATD